MSHPALLNWAATAEDTKLIWQIVDRFEKLAGPLRDWTGMVMDITACHLNGNPLDLQALLEFPNFDFSHDVTGIWNHLDRDTGQLTGFFSPRSSVR